jgi:hypothetical protein
VDSRFHFRGFDFAGFVSSVAASHFLDVGDDMDACRIGGRVCPLSLRHAIRLG